jgi:hypothetical protein
VAARLAAFRRVDLDFTGVDTVGPSVADELFRVIVTPPVGFPSSGPWISRRSGAGHPALVATVVRCKTSSVNAAC